MEITKITPQGFCKGVIYAIKQINIVLKNNKYKKPLYMLGGIVHNQHIIDAFNEKGIEIINTIENINEGTIIITAHGISNTLKQKILSKGLDIIDTTCIEVRKIQDIINKKEKESYSIIYFGTSSHPECKSIIEDHKDLNLIEKIEDIDKLDISNNKLFFASQTTLSNSDVKKAFEILQNKYPYITKASDICNSTFLRQNALNKEIDNFDMILVVGDKNSNNTTKLLSIAKAKKKAYLIENIDDLKKIDFSKVKRLGITAGASAPNLLVDEIIKTIKDKDYISKVVNQDYINI